MQNEFWLNLASKDVIKAKNFYKALGFEINEPRTNEHMLSMFLGRGKVVLNLFPEAMFKNFVGQAITDTRQSNEVLISIGASTRAEVDEFARKAVDAGGTLYGRPADHDGWMYGCGFVDLDGHRWNVLYMDMSKIQKA